jgi:pyridoxamine 5'-phosphate oxidase
MPAHANDLAEVLAAAFRLFSRGVADRRSPFRTPTIATAGLDGAPSARTMVLRGFDPAARRVMLHTDRRAGKLVNLAHTPRVSVHVYDARAALQVRLSALAQVHVDDAVARAAWGAGVPAGRACYAISPAPGTEVPAPPPAPSDTEAGFANFAVLALTFDHAS